MSETKKAPSSLLSIVFLAVAIAIGAHVSAVPLMIVKIAVAVLLVAVYTFFAYRVVNSMQIGATGARTFVGLILALVTVYATWAVRIPAFSGWDTAFTADPAAIWAAVLDRASSMQITKAFGAGTSTEGPSWLLLGTYAVEALAFVFMMTLGAVLAGPAKPKTEVSEAVEAERIAA